MRQSERDMGKFTQAVNSLMEWVEDVDGVECERRRLIIVTGQRARFAVDMSSELNPSMELDALNHNWLLASLQRRLLMPTARARYESH